MTPLGPVQRMLLQELGQAGAMTAIDAGRSVHWRRRGPEHLERFSDGEPCCSFCVDDGREVLESLEARGLVERVDGRWTLVQNNGETTGAAGHAAPA